MDDADSKAIDGSAAPSLAPPNILLNVGGGDKYVFATWDNETETLSPGRCQLARSRQDRLHIWRVGRAAGGREWRHRQQRP